MLLWAAWLLVSAFAGLMWGIVIASADTSVKWWEALAAIGTCLTALLAVVIPWGQNWHRDRTSKRTAAPRRLAAAKTAIDVAGALCLVMNQWKERKGRPHQDMMEAMLARIDLAVSRIEDTDGMGILDDLALYIRALRTQVQSNPGLIEAPPNVFNIYLQCDSARKRAEEWKKTVMEDLDSLGIKHPADRDSSVRPPPQQH